VRKPSKSYPLPDPLPGEDVPSCGADPVGPVSGGFLLEWIKRRGRGYVRARTSRIRDRYLSDEPSGGPICYARVPGSPRLLWLSRIDLVTLFGRGADVDLMAQYAARQKVAKRGREGMMYTKRKPRRKQDGTS